MLFLLVINNINSNNVNNNKKNNCTAIITTFAHRRSELFFPYCLFNQACDTKPNVLKSTSLHELIYEIKAIGNKVDYLLSVFNDASSFLDTPLITVTKKQKSSLKLSFVTTVASH